MDWKKLLILAGLWIGILALNLNVQAQTHRSSELYQTLAFLVPDENVGDFEKLESFFFRPHESKSWFKKALLWRPFLDFQENGWDIGVNPAYHISSNSQNDSGGFYVNARGVFVDVNFKNSFGFTASVYENQTKPIYLNGVDFTENKKLYPGLGRMKLRNPIDAPFFQGEWYARITEKWTIRSGQGKVHTESSFFNPIWSREIAPSFYGKLEKSGQRLEAGAYILRTLGNTPVSEDELSADAFYPSYTVDIITADYWLKEGGKIALSAQSRGGLFNQKNERPILKRQSMVGLRFKGEIWKGFARVNPDNQDVHCAIWVTPIKALALKAEFIQAKTLIEFGDGVNFLDRALPFAEKEIQIFMLEQHYFWKRFNIKGQQFIGDGLATNLELGWTLNPSNYSQVFMAYYENPYIASELRKTEIRFGLKTQLFPQTWR